MDPGLAVTVPAHYGRMVCLIQLHSQAAFDSVLASAHSTNVKAARQIKMNLDTLARSGKRLARHFPSLLDVSLAGNVRGTHCPEVPYLSLAILQSLVTSQLRYEHELQSQSCYGRARPEGVSHQSAATPGLTSLHGPQRQSRHISILG